MLDFATFQNRMEDYFYYHWFNSKGIEHSKMMEDWPRTLKEDTSLFLHRILFAEWPVFNEASTGCRRALSSLVERHGTSCSRILRFKNISLQF